MYYEYYFTQGSLPSLFFTLITEIIYFLLNHSTFVYTNHSVLPWPTVTKINIPTFSSGTFQPTQASNDTSPSTTSHLSVAHDSADHPFTLLYHFHRQAQSTFCFRNSQECQFSSWGSSSRSWQHVQHFNAWSRSTDSTTALPSAIMVNFSTTWTPGFIPSRFDFHHCYFPKYPSDPVAMRQTFFVPFVLSC